MSEPTKDQATRALRRAADNDLASLKRAVSNSKRDPSAGGGAEEWSQETKDAVAEIERQYGIEVVSIEHHAKTIDALTAERHALSVKYVCEVNARKAAEAECDECRNLAIESECKYLAERIRAEAAEAECDRLKEELRDALAAQEFLSSVGTENERLIEELREAREALAFYRDEWLATRDEGTPFEPTDALWEDRGRRARAALPDEKERQT